MISSQVRGILLGPNSVRYRGMVNLRPSLFGALRYLAHIILLLSH